MLCKCSLFLLAFFTNLLPSIKCCEHFTLLLVISSVLLASSFQLRLLCSSHKCIAIQIFIWMYELFKYDIFDNVALSNLENALQTNLRTGRTREYILRVSGGTNFENLHTWLQPWWYLLGFDVYTSLPKKALHTSLTERSLFLTCSSICVL